MDTLFRIIGYLSIPLVLIGVGVAIWSTLRERPLRGRTFLLVVGIGVAYLVVHDLLRGSEISRPFGWLAAGAGGLLGASWAERSRLRKVAGDVLAKGGARYLAVWGLAVVVAQLSALDSLRVGSSLGVYAVYLATGLALGFNAGMWLRLIRTRRSATASCPHCGSAVATGSCGACDRRVLIAAISAGG